MIKHNRNPRRRSSINLVPTLTVLFLGLSLFVLSSCGGGIDSSPSTQITFGCFSHEREAYRALADEFHQIHPDIEVQLRDIDGLFESASSTDVVGMLRELATADTFTWFNTNIAEGAHLGLLYDLQSSLARQADAEADWPPALLDAFRWKGGLYALPVGVDLPVMYYNKDLFERAGVPYPQTGWTWDDLLSQAARLSVREGNESAQYGYVDLSGSAPLAFVYQHGGALGQGETAGDLPLPTLNDPRTVEALTWYVALALEHGVMPNPAQVDATAARALVIDGRVAMWSDLVGHSMEWQQQTSAAIGVAPLPRDAVEASPLLVRGYTVSAGTRYPEASWRWVEYLSRHPEVMIPKGEWFPARKSVFGEAGYQEVVGEESAEAVRYALTHSALPVDQAAALFIDDMSAVFAGEATVADFLTEAQQRALAQYAAVAAATPVPVVVATPVLKRPSRRTTITFGLPSAAKEKAAGYQALAQAFMDLHPDITVQVKTEGDRQGFTHGKMMAEKYDVFLWSEGESAAVLDLTPFVEMSGFPLDDFSPAALAPLTQEGKLWGAPLTLDVVVVVFYNKALFDEAGVPYPQDGWTWDDFLVKARSLTRGEGEKKQYGFLSWFWPIGDVLLYLAGQGLTPVDVATSPPVFSLNTEAMKTALRWWVALDTEWEVMPPLGDMLSWNTGNILPSGRVAMWTDLISTRNYREFYSEDVEIGIVPLPRGTRSVARMAGQVIYISANTKHPRECWQWVRYLSDHLPPAPLAPARISQLHSAAFRQHVGEDIAAAYLGALGADINLDEHQEFYQAIPYLETALRAIASGADVDQALEEAQRQAEAGEPPE
ncbi:MAG: hypothetical protein CVU38_03735 [Chloroflexi bacterium HGW-Chloroflexi-1]|nr:MAG: hypothetical protein CVU38_03735 [Chloroflexi bacterium HGW-Chloroflexi-1]